MFLRVSSLEEGGDRMTYLGECVIDGTLYSMFMQSDGSIIYLP